MNTPRPDMKTDVENALSQAGVVDFTVAQDRNNGVITFSGDVTTNEEKANAHFVTKSVSGS